MAEGREKIADAPSKRKGKPPSGHKEKIVSGKGSWDKGVKILREEGGSNRGVNPPRVGIKDPLTQHPTAKEIQKSKAGTKIRLKSLAKELEQSRRKSEKISGTTESGDLRDRVKEAVGKILPTGEYDRLGGLMSSTVLTAKPTGSGTVLVDFGPLNNLLEGGRLSGLVTKVMLFGPEKIDTRINRELSPRKNIEHAWKIKLKNYKQNKQELSAFYMSKVHPYVEGKKKFAPTSRIEWDKEVGDSIKRVRNSLDFDSFFKETDAIGRGRKEFFLSTLEKIQVAEMNSVTFAELMESQDPAIAEGVFNTVLGHYGKEFIYLFPALGDPHLSFGPAQLMKEAVGKDGGIGIVQSRFFKKGTPKLVPDTMSQIEGRHHHDGGYMFSIFNLYALTRELSESDLVKLDTLSGQSNFMRKITQYIAAAHNKPTDSREAFREWLRKDLKGEFEPILKSITARNNSKKARINYEHATSIAQR